MLSSLPASYITKEEECHCVMANLILTASLGSNQSFGWRIGQFPPGTLVYIGAVPISPSFTSSNWFFTGGGYPYWNQLGISTQWSQLSNDGSGLGQFIVVQNNSNSTIEYELFYTTL